MKAGVFNINDYLERLYEESEGVKSEKGYATEVEGILLPDDAKKNFDWLNKEYQKGKVEVKVEVKGEGSSFKPGYDLQTDLKSVKDFKPGMYGEIKTSDTGTKQGDPTKTDEPKSPKNKNGEVKAEKKDPKGGAEAPDNQDKKTDVSPKKQALNVDTTKKKKDAK